MSTTTSTIGYKHWAIVAAILLGVGESAADSQSALAAYSSPGDRPESALQQLIEPPKLPTNGRPNRRVLGDEPMDFAEYGYGIQDDIPPTDKVAGSRMIARFDWFDVTDYKGQAVVVRQKVANSRSIVHLAGAESLSPSTFYMDYGRRATHKTPMGYSAILGSTPAIPRPSISHRSIVSTHGTIPSQRRS